MCQCVERRKAIVGAVKKPSTVLTAAKFVAKTSGQDVASITRRIVKRLNR